MKTRKNLFVSLVFLAALPLITFCKKEKGPQVQETSVIETPTEDALAETTDLSYVMYGAFDEEFGFALGRRLQGALVSPTMADLFVVDPSTVNNPDAINPDELMTMICRIESRKASVILTKATFREFYDWAQVYTGGYALLDLEDYDGDPDPDDTMESRARHRMANVIHNAYMAGQTDDVETRTTVNGLELDWEHVDTWPVEKQNAIMFDGFAMCGYDELFVMNAAATLDVDAEVRHPQNDHEWGHKADAVVSWLNRKSKEKAQTKAVPGIFTKAGGNVAISDLVDAQTKEYVFDLQYQARDGYYVTSAYSALKVQYTVHSAYDFGGNLEYYQVRQNITVMNDKIYSSPAGDSWWVRENDANFNLARGAWMKSIETKMWLEGGGTKSVVSAGPLNENGSSSGSSSSGGSSTTTIGHTNGLSVGLAGGMSGENPTFSLSAGYSHTWTYSESTGTTWNTSTNWSTKDLTTTFNQGNDANGTVTWTHIGKTPTNADETHVSKLKPLLINTCVTDEQALWKIDNPSGTYRLNAEFRIENETFLIYYHWNRNSAFITKSQRHNISFDLNAPDRYKRKWNNVIYDYGSVTGDIQLTHYLDDYIESTYGYNSANFCWAGLFVSTEATANGSDNACAVFQTFKNSIAGMKFQLYQKGFRGQLKFGLKPDGVSSLTDKIVLDLDNLYSEGETVTEQVNGYDLTFKVTKNNKEVELNDVPGDFSGKLDIPETIAEDMLTVTSLGDNCAVRRKGITAVTIPATVRTIENGALAELDKITEINIPEGVQTIGTWSFHLDNNLTKLYLPSTLTAIRDCAFYECNAITEIHIKATTPPTVGSYNFANKSATLYVPKDYKVSYATADFWKEFKKIVEE